MFSPKECEERLIDAGFYQANAGVCVDPLPRRTDGEPADVTARWYSFKHKDLPGRTVTIFDPRAETLGSIHTHNKIADYHRQNRTVLLEALIEVQMLSETPDKPDDLNTQIRNADALAQARKFRRNRDGRTLGGDIFSFKGVRTRGG